MLVEYLPTHHEVHIEYSQRILASLQGQSSLTLQKQLLLKDQGIAMLRQKVQERVITLSQGDVLAHNGRITALEAENARLRSDLAHRTSQLHSAVARISGLKGKIDSLLR